jgi:hypothetical protein
MSGAQGSSETANNKINQVSHGTSGHNRRPETQIDVNSAENGLHNHQLWQIDLSHVATGKCVAFKAFVTEYSDNFTTNWNTEQVYGRMDPLQIYQNTERRINLGWVVVAVDEFEAEKNLHKFEHLSSMLYPTYDETGGVNTMAAGPLMRIKFVNLVQDVATAGTTSPKAVDGGILGTIDGFAMQPNLDLGFFAPKPGILLPKQYNLTCTISVLHTHALGWSDNNTSKWLAKQDKFPYGINKMSGQHSVCKKGAYKIVAAKTKPKNKKVTKVQTSRALSVNGTRRR